MNYEDEYGTDFEIVAFLSQGEIQNGIKNYWDYL